MVYLFKPSLIKSDRLSTGQFKNLKNDFKKKFLSKLMS